MWGQTTSHSFLHITCQLHLGCLSYSYSYLVGSFSMMLLLSCLWLYVTLCARLGFSESNTAGNGGWSSFAPSLSCAEQTHLNPFIPPQISSRLLWCGLQATSWRKGLKNKNRESWHHMNIVDVGSHEHCRCWRRGVFQRQREMFFYTSTVVWKLFTICWEIP